MALVEAEVEGRIDDVRLVGVGVEVDTMGITIAFTPGTTATGRTRSIKTPQVTLTPAIFADNATKFPGRTLGGFKGGTVIAEGFFDTDNTVLVADFLTVEPAETVVLGALTKNAAGTPRDLRINGMPIVMLTDPRLPANSKIPADPIYLNQYGFPMKIETATLSPTGPTPANPPAPSSVEGYFSDPGEMPAVFHAFKFEYGETGELFVDSKTTPQISMERASYWDRGAEVEFEARGFVTAAHPGASPLGQDVQLYRVDIDDTGTEVEQRIARADIDPVEAGYERWRVRERVAKPGRFRAKPPILIRVKNLSGTIPLVGGNPAMDETEPDTREA